MRRALKASVAATIGVASLALFTACTTPTNPQQTDTPKENPGDDGSQAYLAPSAEQAPAPPGLTLEAARARLG